MNKHPDLEPSRIPLTDLHAHVLPALDDGPETFEESVALLRRAFDGGTRTIVATPHLFRPPFFDYPPEAVRERFRELLEYLADVGLAPEFSFLRELTVCLGAENHASDSFYEALESGSVITLNDTRTFLLEFPMDFSFEEMKHTVRLALDHGLIPVLAHLERYQAMREDPSRAAELAGQGCVCQINAESLLHVVGPRRTAMALLEGNLAIALASDAHDAVSRPANLHEAAARLSKVFPPEKVRRWVQTTPSALLGRREVDVTEFGSQPAAPVGGTGPRAPGGGASSG